MFNYVLLPSFSKFQLTFVQESFCNEVQGILDMLYGFSQGNAELVKQWTFLYVTFCKVS